MGVDFAGLERLVIKVGSALLVDADGRFDPDSVMTLAAEVAALRESGAEVLIVSSGAVAIGLDVLGLERRRARLDELQAAAAAGQVQLVDAWQSAFANHGLKVAQVLLTPDDTENRRRFLNARGTLSRLIALGVVPVINENDTVATEELRYGDNDRLAARVAQLVMADGLVLLSDVDGLYSADPRRDPDARHIGCVQHIDDRVLGTAGGSASAVGSGGMRTKLEAARIATRAGCATYVASGRVQRPLTGLGGSHRHTLFVPETTPAAARKQWLAGTLELRGAIGIDAGAAEALATGGSLLPVGIVSVVGGFRRGDAVAITNDGKANDGSGEIGRGIAGYDADEVRAIMGRRSGSIAERLGYRGRPVVVHHDDLVIFRGEG